MGLREKGGGGGGGGSGGTATLADNQVTPPKLDADDAMKQDAFLTRLNALRRDVGNIKTLTANAQRAALISLGSLIDGPRPAPSADYADRTWIDDSNNRIYVCRNYQEVSTALGGTFSDADTTMLGIEIAERVADLETASTVTDYAYTSNDNKWWVGVVSGSTHVWRETAPTNALGRLTIAPGWSTVWLGQEQWDGVALGRLPQSALPDDIDYYFYNSRTVTVRKFNRSSYSATGAVSDHWQWGLLTASAAEIDIIEARNGNLPSLASDGADDRKIAISNDGIHYVRLEPEAQTPATASTWVAYDPTISGRDYQGVFTDDPSTSAADVGDYYYNSSSRRYRVFRGSDPWAWFDDHWEDMSDRDVAWPDRFIGHYSSRADALAHAAQNGITARQTFVAFTGSIIEGAAGFAPGVGARFSRHWSFLHNPGTSPASTSDDYLTALVFTVASGVLSATATLHQGDTFDVTGADLIASKAYVDAGGGISDGAVSTSKLANRAVTNQKIGNNAVSEGKILDGAVTKIKLANSSVDTDKLTTGAVTGEKLRTYAVSSTHLNANSGVNKAAFRAVLGVLSEAQVDARALVRFTAAEKTKLSSLTAITVADVLTKILAGTGITINRDVDNQITLTSTGTGGTVVASLSVADALPTAALLSRTLLAAVGAAGDTGLTSGPHYRREGVTGNISLRADRLGAGRVGFSTYNLGELGGYRSAESGGSLTPPIAEVSTLMIEPNIGLDTYVRSSDRDIRLPSGTWAGAVTAGPTIWFVGSDGRVIAYEEATGDADSAKDIVLTGSGWGGATSNGTILWFLDNSGNFLHGYTASTRALAVNSNVGLGTGDWSAVTTDGTTIWVYDRTDMTAKAWNVSGGTRNSARDIVITTTGVDINAAFCDGITLWFADATSGGGIAYAAANGAREEHKDIALGVASWSGGTLSGETLWVVDQKVAAQDARVFELSGGGGRVILEATDTTDGVIYDVTGPISVAFGGALVVLDGPVTTSRFGVRRWISGYVPANLILPEQQYTVTMFTNTGFLFLHPGDWLAPLIDPVSLDKEIIGLEHRAVVEAERASPIRDITLAGGVPALDESNYHEIQIDHSIPRAWIGKQIPAPGTPAVGTATAWSLPKFLGAFDTAPTAPQADNGYIYYDRQLQVWQYQLRGAGADSWLTGNISTVTRNKADFPDTYSWIGSWDSATAAAGFIFVYRVGRVFLFFNTTTQVVESVDRLSFVAAQDHTWRYEPSPLPTSEDVEKLKVLVAELRVATHHEVLVDNFDATTGIEIATSMDSWQFSQGIPFNRQLTAADDDKLLVVEMGWREEPDSTALEPFILRTHTGFVSARLFREYGQRLFTAGNYQSVTDSGDWYVRRANYVGVSGNGGLQSWAEMRLMYSRYRLNDANDAASNSALGTGNDGIVFHLGMSNTESSNNSTDVTRFRIRVTLRP